MVGVAEPAEFDVSVGLLVRRRAAWSVGRSRGRKVRIAVLTGLVSSQLSKKTWSVKKPTSRRQARRRDNE